jgi:uncharacterized protein YdeI (YjbR/CyaY-like superfamily)
VIPTERFVQVEVSSVRELHDWLEQHHDQRDAVWLVTFKKSIPEKYLSRDEVLDALVAHGWTDGLRRQLDDERTMQLVSPRRTKPWAKSYKDRADQLIIEGRMRPAGLESVRLAKETGAWEEMNDVDALVVPDDLQESLEHHAPALTNFSEFPPSTRRNILRWLESARTAPTRQRRIQRISKDAKQGIRTASNG